MNTIDTVAQAIAQTAPFYPAYIAEVLADSGADENFFEEMERLASDNETSVEVLDAIDAYCSEREDSDVQDDPHYSIGEAARENLARR